MVSSYPFQLGHMQAILDALTILNGKKFWALPNYYYICILI